MTGSEFLRKLMRLAKQNNIKVEIIQRRGKGSHSTLIYGSHFTIIRNLKDELKSGTIHAMLKQLNINTKEWRNNHE